jgi:hypothetical protein
VRKTGVLGFHYDGVCHVAGYGLSHSMKGNKRVCRRCARLSRLYRRDRRIRGSERELLDFFR